MKTLPVLAVLLSTSLGACAPAILVGTGAAVSRSVFQERTTGAALTDAEIEFSIQNALGRESGELFRDVHVDVHEARVVLTGSVPSRRDKIAATRLAWDTSGVREVTDETSVHEDSGTTAYLEDVWISNKVRYKLATDLSISGVNYTVTTVDKVVHITGLARSEAELQRTLQHAAQTRGVVKVVNHALTLNDPKRLDQLAKSG